MFIAEITITIRSADNAFTIGSIFGTDQLLYRFKKLMTDSITHEYMIERYRNAGIRRNGRIRIMYRSCIFVKNKNEANADKDKAKNNDWFQERFFQYRNVIAKIVNPATTVPTVR